MWSSTDEGDALSSSPVPSQPPEPALSRDLLDLFSTLTSRSVPYLLVGGVAMLRYIEGRNTDDIDLLLSVDSLGRMPELTIRDHDPDFARSTFRSLRVDLLLTANPLFKHVLDHHATTHQFHEIAVPCATVEGLVLLKLYALPSLYHQGDLQRAALYEADITMLAQRYRTALNPLLEILRPRLERGQFQELAAIVQEIEARIARMERTK
jgi:hypothetical protein